MREIRVQGQLVDREHQVKASHEVAEALRAFHYVVGIRRGSGKWRGAPVLNIEWGSREPDDVIEFVADTVCGMIGYQYEIVGVGTRYLRVVVGATLFIH